MEFDEEDAKGQKVLVIAVVGVLDGVGKGDWRTACEYETSVRTLKVF